MKSRQIDGNWLLRFELGDNLNEQIVVWANSNNVKSGFFHGLGGAIQVTLGFYSLAERQYHFIDIEEPLEIVSLHGNLSQKDGNLKIHAHGTVADSSFKTKGGHIKNMVTGPTLELLVTPFSQILQRRPDDEIGLDLLEI